MENFIEEELKGQKRVGTLSAALHLVKTCFNNNFLQNYLKNSKPIQEAKKEIAALSASNRKPTVPLADFLDSLKPIAHLLNKKVAKSYFRKHQPIIEYGPYQKLYTLDVGDFFKETCQISGTLHSNLIDVAREFFNQPYPHATLGTVLVRMHSEEYSKGRMEPSSLPDTTIYKIALFLKPLTSIPESFDLRMLEEIAKKHPAEFKRIIEKIRLIRPPNKDQIQVLESIREFAPEQHGQILRNLRLSEMPDLEEQIDGLLNYVCQYLTQEEFKKTIENLQIPESPKAHQIKLLDALKEEYPITFWKKIMEGTRLSNLPDEGSFKGLEYLQKNSTLKQFEQMVKRIKPITAYNQGIKPALELIEKELPHQCNRIVKNIEYDPNFRKDFRKNVQSVIRWFEVEAQRFTEANRTKIKSVKKNT
ncbi:MAG: hypothetical protein K2P90_02970 [Holosporales bacterium]|nr:hypothetical protein [Holosporales bacterium]